MRQLQPIWRVIMCCQSCEHQLSFNASPTNASFVVPAQQVSCSLTEIAYALLLLLLLLLQALLLAPSRSSCLTTMASHCHHSEGWPIRWGAVAHGNELLIAAA
jgi:hypothetical protein